MKSILLVLLCSLLASARDCDLIGLLGPSNQVEAAIKEFASFVNYHSDNILNPADFQNQATQMTISLAVPMKCADLLHTAENLETKYSDIEIRVGRSAYLKEKSQ